MSRRRFLEFQAGFQAPSGQTLDVAGAIASESEIEALDHAARLKLSEDDPVEEFASRQT